MRRYRTIHKQMVVRIVIAVTIAITIISAFSYNAIRSIIQEHVELTMQSKAQTLVNEIEGIVSQQKSMLHTYSNFIKQAYSNNNTKLDIEHITREFVNQHNPLVYGYWYISQSNYDNKGDLFTWYGLNGEEGVADFRKRYQADSVFSKNLYDPEYDYYYGALQEGGMHITNPYLDEFVHIPMLSVSIPLYDEAAVLMGGSGFRYTISGYARIFVCFTARYCSRLDAAIIESWISDLQQNCAPYR